MAAEVVFSSPDPAEAEEVRALLERKGLDPRLYSGPDPVTGVGGHLFGGAGAHMYNVEVQAARADSARDVLSRLPPPAEVSPEDEPPRPQRPLLGRLRPLARPAILLYLIVALVLVPLVLTLEPSVRDAPGAAWALLYVLVILGIAVLMERRR